MNSKTRSIKTERSINQDYLVFRLEGGNDKSEPHTMFGYSSKHRHWVRIIECGDGNIVMSESAADAKSTIRSWCNQG